MRAFTLVLAFSLSGCGLSYFANRSENPVVFDPIGPTGFLGAPRSFAAISAQAGRSTLLVNIDKTDKLYGTFCAAPPPDAAENLATYFALKASAEVTEPKTQIKGNGTLELEDSLARSLAPLVRRSQGLELFKYGMFYYCQDYLNGRITGQTLVDLRQELLQASIGAILKEVANDKWYGFPPAYGAPELQGKLFDCIPDPDNPKQFRCRTTGASSASKKTDATELKAETPAPDEGQVNKPTDDQSTGAASEETEEPEDPQSTE